jgi:hypothetical protein
MFGAPSQIPTAFAEINTSTPSPARPTAVANLPAAVVERLISYVDGTITFRDVNQRLTTVLSNGPWPASQVCQSWRTAALSPESCWSAISVTYLAALNSTGAFYSPLGVFKLIEEGLLRSGTSKLNVHICFRDSVGEDVKDAAFPREVVHLLLHSSRFQRLALHVPNTPYAARLLRSSQAGVDFQNLQVLDLKLPAATQSGDSGDDTQDIMGHFTDASNLSVVVLGSTGLDTPRFRTAIGSLPLHQLTSLQLEEHLPLEDVLDLLQKCPLLKRYRNSQVLINTESSRVVEHQELRRLHIVGSAEFLQHLKLPKLVDLSMFDTKPGSSEAGHEYLSDFIARSGCDLKALDFNVSRDIPRHLLSLLGSLTQITISFGPNTAIEDHAKAVHFRDLVASLSHLPDLEDIMISDYQFDHGHLEHYTQQHIDVLIQVIRSHKKLKVFHVTDRLESVLFDYDECVYLEDLLTPYAWLLRPRIDAGAKLIFFTGRIF